MTRARGRPERHVAGQMNAGETKYAFHLEQQKRCGMIANWRFESVKLRLADLCFYTPDFDVMLLDGTLEFHEVKGRTTVARKNGIRTEAPWAREDSKIKIRVAAEQYPEFAFAVVYPSDQGGWARLDYTPAESRAEIGTRQ